MNDKQRQQIEEMRKNGRGYKLIARKLELSRDSVRHFCQDRNLAGYGTALAATFREEKTCENI